MRYQLIRPDGTNGQIYQGEMGMIYVQSVCAENPGWTWIELGAWREMDDPEVIELKIDDAAHKSKADT